MDVRYLVLELRLELGPPDADAASTPTGWLRGRTGPPRRFEGYVQLIGALHELYHGATPAENSEVSPK
jgi:hypothetical protein